ncbi:MAG: hypothetical protein JJU35_07100 [Balneolales bacterium]|nr:hypothetical protein [Balneolales bacterium]
MRFSKALMQLFWTAGPVTAIGLTLGYYIGYGKMPPTELMIYFISFTVFSGLTGLLAKFVYDSTRGHVQQQREQDSKFITGEIGSLVLDVRNLQIEAYEGPERKREAALQLIRRVELSPYGTYLAFTDLTGDRKTGLIMSRMHIYRKAGLFSYVNNLQNRFRPYITEKTGLLETDSPDTAAILITRFEQTKGTSLRQGVEREPFFLQRIFAAVEKDDPYLITLKDAEEFLILCLELISGRELPVLFFSYRGNWAVAEAFDTLERSRMAYRIAQAKGSNRIFALAAYLRESGVCDETNIPKGLAPAELARFLYQELDRLSETIEQMHAKGMSKNEKTAHKLVLENGLKLYEMAVKGYADVGKTRERYLSAVSGWNRLSSKPDRIRFIQNRWSRRGIDVNETSLSLSSEHKDELVRHLSWYFRQGGIAPLLKAHHVGEVPDTGYNDRCEAVRRLVIETAVILDPMIGLSKPEIRRNLNATKAMYLGELSPDLTAVQKQQLFERLVQETDNSLSAAAEQMAHTMVNVYRIPLSDEAVNFLHLSYGASREKLRLITEQAQETAGTGTQSSALQTLPDGPDTALSKLRPVSAQWRKALRT